VVLTKYVIVGRLVEVLALMRLNVGISDVV
jgi:hypothetical protein